MTITETPRAPDGQDIVLFAKVGSQQFSFTATQLRDTVASYLARGTPMPTPTDINKHDPNEPLHIIVEEWLYGNVQGWLDSTDILHLTTYREQAMTWIRAYFGPNIPDPQER